MAIIPFKDMELNSDKSTGPWSRCCSGSNLVFSPPPAAWQIETKQRAQNLGVDSKSAVIKAMEAV